MTLTRSRQRALGAAAGLAGVLALILSVHSEPGVAQSKQARPNIVQVMTDDQTVESLRVMPNVRALLANRGTTFRNYVDSYALCCPSRATWLTGQYAHNHGVRGNTLPAGGYSKIAGKLSNSLPVWLRSAGYYTAHIGKFLNGYGTTSPDTEVPPGWNNWMGSLDNPDAYTGGTYTMYGYTLNQNGSIVHYGSTPDVVDPATYQTDVYSAKAEAVIRDRAPRNKPFYLSVAPLAPHGEAASCNCAGNNPRAAPRHEGDLASQALPQPPSFNEADVSDKPAEIKNMTVMNNTQINTVRNRYRARLESLLAVDEMVQNIVDALRDTGELGRTVVIFTSDNGFFHGEHRIRTGKVRLYEESIKVPMIIRGPGIPRGVTRGQLSSNVDLAPTILDIANAKAGRRVDGRSLLPLASDRLLNPGRAIVLETFFNADDPNEDPENPPPRYRAIRTDRYVYAEHGTGEQELYDLETDPFELSSLHADPAHAALRSRLANLLHRLQECDGKACRSRPALRLRTRFRRGPNGCVDGGVRVRVIGKQRKQALDASFFAGKRKAGRDLKRPLRRKVPRKKLRRRGKTRIRALVTMIDGRRTTITKAVPRKC